MPERKIEASTAKGDSASETVLPTETRAERKSRLAAVYDRGVTGDRLHVDLPPDLDGEWVPTTGGGTAVARKKALGYWIDKEYAKNHSALHDKGDEGSHVGDVVFMVTTRDNKELLDEIKKERFREAHLPKGGKHKEERDFLNQADREVKPLAESNASKASVSDITDALKAVVNQNS